MAGKKISQDDVPYTEAEATETEAATEVTKPEEKEYKHFIYIGPALPGGSLKKNAVLNGTYEEIINYYKDVLAQYPQAAKLIVPVRKLGENRDKVQTPGNIIHKYYDDIVSGMRKSEED